jgi:hypothetical protein
METESKLPVELAIKRYRGKKGVYFIKCYEGICKIGQSDNLSARLTSY